MRVGCAPRDDGESEKKKRKNEKKDEEEKDEGSTTTKWHPVGDSAPHAGEM